MCTPRRFHPKAFKFQGGGGHPGHPGNPGHPGHLANPGPGAEPDAAGADAADRPPRPFEDSAEGRRLLDLALGAVVLSEARSIDQAWAAAKATSEAETKRGRKAAARQQAEAAREAKAERRVRKKVLEDARAVMAEADADRPPGHAVFAKAGKTVVEVTARVRGGQYLLRPDAALNSLVAGSIGRAQAHTGVLVGAVGVMSNHLSQVVAVDSPEQLADFNNRNLGQIGDRVGRLRGIRMRIWGRRNRSIVVDANATDVSERLQYCMANGTKENLVTHPSQWPGLNSARVFVLGERMVGKWTDYTAFGRARRRDPTVSEADFQIEYEVVHSKMPGLDHLSDEDYRALMCRLCDEAAEKAAAKRLSDKVPEPGEPQRLTQIPFEHIPDEVSVSSAPAVHAHDPERRKLYRALVRAYREHLRAVRQSLADHLARTGQALAGEGIPATGWRPIDPSTVVPPVGIQLTEAASS